MGGGGLIDMNRDPTSERIPHQSAFLLLQLKNRLVLLVPSPSTMD